MNEDPVTGFAQKVLRRKNLKASIRCRQSDRAKAARIIREINRNLGFGLISLGLTGTGLTSMFYQNVLTEAIST